MATNSTLIKVLLLLAFFCLTINAEDNDLETRATQKYAHPIPHFKAIKIAHSVLACVAWVVFFPLGAVLIRVLNKPAPVWVHAGIQGFSILLITASAALGIWMSKKIHKLDKYHPVIGLLVLAFAFVQALGGFLQHYLFRRYRRRTIVGVLHIWLGRILITLGMINGGLGLLWSNDASRGERIAYGVVTGIIWLAYAIFSVWSDVTNKAGKKDSMKIGNGKGGNGKYALDEVEKSSKGSDSER